MRMLYIGKISDIMTIWRRSVSPTRYVYYIRIQAGRQAIFDVVTPNVLWIEGKSKKHTMVLFKAIELGAASITRE